MLELPEAQTIAAQAAKIWTGKTVKAAEAGHTPHGFAFYEGNPADYPTRLVGRTVTGASACGGYAVLDLGGTHLSFSDGVNARYLAPGERRPDRHQLLVSFDDGSALVCTVQMYGAMLAYEGEAGGFYARVARDKPSPLSGEFDEAYFEALTAAAPKNFSAKALLATKQAIPGLGNGCLQDILFAAKVHPKTKCAALSSGEKEALYKAVKGTLSAMTEAGGRDTEKDLYGRPGGYRTLLSARTAALPCPVCGGPITRQAYLGGNVYFCPVCQPLK